MAEQTPGSLGVELLEVDRLRLVEVAPPTMSAEQRAAMNRAWDEAVEANPSFFDGPLAVCAGLDREPSGELVVSWSRTTYRYLALRRVPGATLRRSLFVSVVQPTDDGRVLVGRMSSSTAAPGHWQLPGGSIEPPTGRTPLDETALRRHAAVELAEETGIDTPADELTRRVVIHRSDGQIGVQYLAPSRPASQLHERFAALVAEEAAQGRDPEFDRIALIGSPAELADLSGPHVVYLEPLVRHHMASRLLGGPQDPRPR